MKKTLSIILAIFLVFALANPVPAARDFTAVTGDYVELLDSPISAYPFTMAGRFKIDDFPNAFSPAITLYRHDTGVIDYGIGPHYLNWSIYARNSSFDLAGSSENTTGEWGQLVGVFASATDRRLYLDGVQIVSDTSSVAFNGIVNKFALGAKIDNGPNASFNGQAAEVCLWAAELTTGEITALANGAKPYEVQPASLKIYWPTWGSSPEPDLSGNEENGTVAGTTVVDHSPTGPYVHP